jgi:hypothetical protein
MSNGKTAVLKVFSIIFGVVFIIIGIIVFFELL